MTSISLLSLIISPFPYAALNVKVDGDYLVGARSKGGYPARWASKSHLAIPHGMHMTGIQPTADLTHPRIPESIKVRLEEVLYEHLPEVYYLSQLSNF